MNNLKNDEYLRGHLDGWHDAKENVQRNIDEQSKKYREGYMDSWNSCKTLKN